MQKKSNIIKRIFGHLHTVNKHRFKVFILACKAGIPIRGLLHDLSKYSLEEFIESVKYYDGKRSPISYCKKDIGYSKCWLHHIAKNKHHFEYWIDIAAPIKAPVMPYKYTVEMICDNIAAGMTYLNKDWNESEPLRYFLERKDREYINPKIQNTLIEVYKQLQEEGLDKTINRKNLKKIYYKNVINQE